MSHLAVGWASGPERIRSHRSSHDLLTAKDARSLNRAGTETGKHLSFFNVKQLPTKLMI